MTDTYKIRHISIDFSDHKIRSNGIELGIDHKAVEVLEMLLKNDEKTVSFDAFMDKVWAGKPSSPEVIPGAIARLRKLFKLAGISEEMIVTVHKIGYRFEKLAELQPHAQEPQKKIPTLFKWILFAFLAALFVSLMLNVKQYKSMNKMLDLSKTQVATIKQESKSNVTQIYILRHTEKSDLSSEDPTLSEAGVKRANYWKQVVQHVDFDRIFTTNFIRNIETADIMAEGLNIKPELYYPMSFEVLKFVQKIQGQKVLIIGHSNTIPDMVNRLIDEIRYAPMSHKNYNLMYLITINENGDTSSSLLNIKTP
ncbi:MAG: winged helix-turn-helix domain-containing protein [Proteobacteria bacterium]|nr:winged helix-turn-helix domain-containing protein [Pseudomonadota bacterium]